MNPKYLKNKRWIRRLALRLRWRRGNRCLVCQLHAREGAKLQWAHRSETGLSGEGRGQSKRILDVFKHPRAYSLMCIPDHHLYDAGILRPPSRSRGWRCDLEVVEYLPRDNEIRRLVFPPPKIAATLDARPYSNGIEVGLGEFSPDDPRFAR